MDTAKRFPQDDQSQTCILTSNAHDPRSRADHAMRARDDLFRALVDHSDEFIGICDMRAVPLYVNPSGLRLVGLDDVAHARRVGVVDFFFPEDRQFVRDEFFPRVLRERQCETEIRFRHFKTGTALWMNYKVFALQDAKGYHVGFGTVSQDITAARKFAQDALLDVNRRKDMFIATLAHELRQPIAAMLPALTLMRQRVSRHSGGHARDIVERQVTQLRRMIDDLLDSTRVAQGKVDLQKRRIDIRQVVEDALSATVSLFDRHRHTVSVSLPDVPVWLPADAGRLQQVLSNLLTNAAKYTDDGGRLWVTVTDNKATVTISVRDNGRGIAPQALPFVFDLFTQADTEQRAGLGIGLNVVRGLVDLHGGTVVAHSDGPGKGSEFTITLPVQPAIAET